MQVLIANLQKELVELFSKYVNALSPELQEKKVRLSESLQLLAPIQGQSYSLFDLDEGKIFSHHSIYENSIHHPAVNHQQNEDSASFTGLLKPEDLILILKRIKAGLTFLNWLPSKRTNDFSFNYQIKLKNRNDDYENYIFNCKVVLTDLTGKPWLLLLQSKLCPFPQTEDEKLYQIFTIEPADLFKQSRILNKNEYTSFTNREKEVMQEVNRCLTKKQIAEVLSITEKTVKTHFENINEKMGVHSTSLACLFASKMGFIPE